MLSSICLAVTMSALGADLAMLEVPHWNADRKADILRIGRFNAAAGPGGPSGWTGPAGKAGTARVRPGGPGILVLRATGGQPAVVSATVDLPPKTEYLTFIVRQRGLAESRGRTNSPSGGVRFSFVNDERQRELPPIGASFAASREWSNQISTAQVPAGEKRLRVSVSLSGAATLEVDDILVVPSHPRDEATFQQGQQLMTALDNDDAEAIAEMVKSDPRMLEMRAGWENNGTPLVRAAWKGAPKVAAKLIELGADVEASDYQWRNTPMRWASWWGNHEVTAVLIRAGADPSGARELAQVAKTANDATKRDKGDFDRVAQLIAEYEEKKKQSRPVRFAWFVSFSPDGTRLVSSHGGWGGDEQGELRVWDVGKETVAIVIPSDRGVRTAAWSPTGKLLASGNYGGEVRLYDSRTGKLIRTISTADTPAKGGSVELLQFTPDERRLVAGSGNGEVWIWEVATGKLVRTLSGHDAEVWGVRVSPDGKTVASASKDRTVRVWDIETGKQQHLLAHPGTINGLAFSPDGRHLATGCLDGAIRIWNLRSGEAMRTLTGHRNAINDLDYSPDGERLASSGSDRTVRLWDLKSGQELAAFEGHEQPVYGVRFAPDGGVLASGSWDGTVKLWDVKRRKLRTTLRREPPPRD